MKNKTKQKKPSKQQKYTPGKVKVIKIYCCAPKEYLRPTKKPMYKSSWEVNKNRDYFLAQINMNVQKDFKKSGLNIDIKEFCKRLETQNFNPCLFSLWMAIKYKSFQQ